MNAGAGRLAMGKVVAAPRRGRHRAGRCTQDVSESRPPASRRRPRGAARLSVGGESVRHLPDRRAVAGARPDRAFAHVSRRLRRHDLAGADDGGRDRRLHGRHLRHERHRRDQPRLAVVGRRDARARHRDAGRDVHRLAVGAHRGHLHHHDHAGGRRRVLLPLPAELSRCSTDSRASSRCIRRSSSG